MLPFGRFPGVDTVLGPEMRSTGEVMGVDPDPGLALAKALVASGAALPSSGTVFLSVANRDKRAIVYPAKRLADLGFRLLATRGTAGCSSEPASPSRASRRCPRPVRARARSIVDLIREGSVDMVVNTPFGRGPRTDRLADPDRGVAAGIPCVTTLPGAMAALRRIEALREGAGVAPLAAGAARTASRRGDGPAAAADRIARTRGGVVKRSAPRC